MVAKSRLGAAEINTNKVRRGRLLQRLQSGIGGIDVELVGKSISTTRQAFAALVSPRNDLSRRTSSTGIA